MASDLSETVAQLQIRVWAQHINDARTTRDITILPRDTHSAFHVGDPVTIGFQASVDCYAVLINEGTSGQQTVLFPNVYTQDNWLRAGISYWFPNPGHPFEFRLEGPPGTETIWALAALKSVWRYGADFDQNLAAVLNGEHAEAHCYVQVSLPYAPAIPPTQAVDRATLVKLRDFLYAYFDEPELEDICFELGDDYQSLRGEGRRGKVLELVRHFERRGRVPELIALCRRLRPRAPW